MNKLLMEENDRLEKQVSQLVYENSYFCQYTPSPGPDSIGIISISHGCTGVAARACGLVGLEPNKVAEMLKGPSWFRDCGVVDVLNVLPTASGGTIEILYMQVFSTFVFVHKITTFEKTAGFQALVQFSDIETAYSAKDSLDGRNIPSGTDENDVGTCSELKLVR